MRLIDADALIPLIQEEKIEGKILDIVEAFRDGLTGFQVEALNRACDRHIKMINSLPTIESASRWIPCSEIMPPEGENVLLCNTFSGNVAIGKLIRYNTSCCWKVDHWDYGIEDWQAWMPRPNPYKPTIESEPKYGRWVNKPHKMMGECSCCSECGFFNPIEYRYCPNCGAEMEPSKGE